MTAHTPNAAPVEIDFAECFELIGQPYRAERSRTWRRIASSRRSSESMIYSAATRVVCNCGQIVARCGHGAGEDTAVDA